MTDLRMNHPIWIGALLATGVIIGICCSPTSSRKESSRTLEELSQPSPSSREQTVASSLQREEIEREVQAETILYDLGAYPAHAELRQHHGSFASLVIDFGTPSAAKYTLGGWRTRVGKNHDFAGTSATLLEGTVGEFLLPAEHIGAATLTLRARTFSDPRVTLYINDDFIRHVRFPADGTFDTVQIEIPSGTLIAGENRLMLRAASIGRRQGVRAGVAVDWLRLGPPEDNRDSPPSLAVPLQLPSSWELSWAMEVPAGAFFLAHARGEISVRIDRDGHPSRTLGRYSGEIRIDLSELEGEIIRLGVQAEQDAFLSQPRIVKYETPAPPAASPSVRNVIVWLVDTVRADRLRPWNAETRVQTPGLMRWIQSTAIFEQGRTQENWTKPSVATLLSGLFPWEHTASTGEAVLPRSVDLLSETLDEAGFYTGAFVCNGYVSGKFGFRQGWDTWRNYIREGRRSSARFVASDVLSWLDERPVDEPFFLYVHTIDPHVPYLPPEDTLSLYDSEPYRGPVDFRRDRGLLEKIKAGQLRLSSRDRERLEALYDGEITYHDVHFASVMDGLERRGLADDTIVVFTADHGEEFFEHDSVGHGHSLFEELLHVPLVMRVPGVTDSSMRIAEQVGLVDVVPTLFDALGREIPAELSGRSVLPLLRGVRERSPHANIAGFLDGWRSIVVGRFKLIHRTHRRWMLFDLNADPQELHDIAAQRPLTVRYLRGLLGLAIKNEKRYQARETEIDAETRAQLEALGYVQGQPR